MPDSRTTIVPSRPASDGRDPVDDAARLARLMDALVEIPGLRLRFGLDALLGLLPGVGDTLTALASLYILQTAAGSGVPRVTLVRMTMNILIDVLLGCVPLLGDLFDVAWKANLKNVALLERHLASSPADARRARRGDWLFVILAAAVVFGAVLTVAALSIWLLRTLFAAAF